MIRPIVRYGDPVLNRQARPVGAITSEIVALVDDLIETMYAAPGVGLAAPQVGVPLRLFVIDPSFGRTSDELVVMIDPEFVEREGMQLEEEGCLSLPGFNSTVARPQRAVVRGRNRDGVLQTREGTGLLARAFQHEMDHLDGRVFLERLRGVKRDLILRRVQKLRRSGKW